MRLFIAINLPATQRAIISQTQQQLRAQIQSRGAKWVAPENVHLTLQFMGEVDAQLVPKIEAALRAACERSASFELQTGGIGCFPDPRKPRVVWLGLNGDLEDLRQLQSAVAAAVAPFHAQRDEKSFKPHLTLARVKTFDRDEARAIGRAVQQAEASSYESWRVESVELIQSELKPSGPVYTPLAEVKL
jgi:2'-5' RNA ligase